MPNYNRKISENQSQSAASQLAKKKTNKSISPKIAQLQAVSSNHPSEPIPSVQKKKNNTGLPDDLKSGVENLSGLSMDDVNVHYNSTKPAQLQAHAYAQGNQIHVAPGQEKFLPHEAWHVVQQKQGRVKPTVQMKGKVNINDDPGLENEADIMGSKSLIKVKIAGNPYQFVPKTNLKTAPIQFGRNGGGKKKSGGGSGSAPKWTNAAQLVQLAKSQMQRQPPEMVVKYIDLQIKNSGRSPDEQKALKAETETILSESTPAARAVAADPVEQAIREFYKTFSIDHVRPHPAPLEPMLIDHIPGPLGDTGDVAYVANLIATPTELAPMIAKYKGIVPDGMPFAMVIGLNTFESIDPSGLDKLKAVKIPTNAPFPVTVIRFSWGMNWNQPIEKIRVFAEKKIEELRIALHGDDEIEKKLQAFRGKIREIEKAHLGGPHNAIPYGKLRSFVLESSDNHQYVNEFREKGKHVYIFNSDADAPSFRTAEQHQGTDRTLLRGYSDTLKQKGYPSLMVGGYRFDHKESGGDLDQANPSHRLTLLANHLDSQFRILVSKLNPELIYPTEPNMVFLAARPDEAKTRLAKMTRRRDAHRVYPSWGVMKREGVDLRETLRAVDSHTQTHYEPHLATPTDSTRFQVPKARTTKSIREFLEERIKAMFAEEQTYITKLAVMVSSSGMKQNAKINPDGIKAMMLHALMNPKSIKDQGKPPAQANEAREIQAQLDGGLIQHFIFQNRGLIEHINAELIAQFHHMQQFSTQGSAGGASGSEASGSGSSSATASSTEEKSTPPAPTSGKEAATKSGKIKEENVSAGGMLFNPIDGRVKGGGQCLWDSLMVEGIPEAILKAAAEQTGLTFGNHVEWTHLTTLIKKVNELSKAKHGNTYNLSLFIIEYGHENHPVPVHMNLDGSHQINLALFSTTEDLLGHYVPPSK